MRFPSAPIGVALVRTVRRATASPRAVRFLGPHVRARDALGLVSSQFVVVIFRGASVSYRM